MTRLALICTLFALASPAFGQSSWPANKVDFADAANLEAKVADGSIGANAPHVSTSETATQTIASELQKGTDAFWNAGNDGPGSGLDADTLDGSQASAFYSGATPLAATAYAGPVEVWLGRPKLMSEGASPTSNYLQSTEFAHMGDATKITFNNTQDRYNMELEGATGGSLFLISIGAWVDSGVCKFSIYAQDTIGITKDVGSGVTQDRGTVTSIYLAAGATTDIQLWASSCTLTDPTKWHSFWKIARY